MTYLVTCTFSLKNASVDDYRTAYTDLMAMGLRKVVVSEQTVQVVLPATMTIGQFSGPSASVVQTQVRERVTAAFAERGYTSDIFVIAGTDWAWGSAHTSGRAAATMDAPPVDLKQS